MTFDIDYYETEADDLLRAYITTSLENFGAVATALLELGCAITAGSGCLDTVQIDATVGDSMRIGAPLAANAANTAGASSSPSLPAPSSRSAARCTMTDLGSGKNGKPPRKGGKQLGRMWEARPEYRRPAAPDAPKPDPRTSVEALDAADTSYHWEAIKRAVTATGPRGACWDEICNAIDQERLADGYNTRVRPGSISARLLEMRKAGELRLKRGADGKPETRAGDSGFEQRIYLIRGEDEKIDAVESNIDDYLGEGHGDGCLHCQLRATIRTFCIAHPEIYSDEVLAAIAGVVGDRLAAEESKYVSTDIRDLWLWIRQRVKSIWKKRMG